MPDQREIDRALVISAMNRAKQNEEAEATQLVRKALSPSKPMNLLSSSFLRNASLNSNASNIASSCPSTLSMIEKQPDVVLDTTVNSNSNATNDNHSNASPTDDIEIS